MDLFATDNNTEEQDPGSLTDTFLLDTNQTFVYVFSPILLIPRVLWKIRWDRAKMLLVAPPGPVRVWYPHLVDLMVDHPGPLTKIAHFLSEKWNSECLDAGWLNTVL